MELKLTREDFLNQYPPSNCLNKRDLTGIWNKEGFNLYVHIPYCYKKCEFCYYKSLELFDEGVPDAYIDALLKEIDMVSQIPQVQSKTASSVYFGGGTPTKMSTFQIRKVMDKIINSFHLSQNYELCFEARPGAETNEEKLRVLKDYGIKRISFGAQSLNESILKDNGRNHDARAFYEVFELARKIGIPSINVDIMSGMVNETLQSFLETIRQLLKLHPENISIYKLELYLNNALYRKLRSKQLTLLDDDEEARFAKIGFQEIMDGGYIPVTSFTFASDKKYTHVHREKLWGEGEDMLGIGASAHSCFNNYLFQNEIDVEKYINRINQGELPAMRAYAMSKREEMIQRLIFGMKTVDYPMQRFQDEFGIDVMSLYGRELEFLREKGFIKITDMHINLTLTGMLYADDIVRLFYLPHQKETYLSHAARGRN